MSRKFNQKRRQFLQRLAVVAGGSSFLSYQGKLQLIQSAMAATGDYSTITDHKTLVCVFLFGGNDSFNMFLPYDAAERTNYEAARGALAIPTGDLVTAGTVVGDYAFHPSMNDIAALYRSGKLAVVANTGNLIEPVTRDQYINRNSLGTRLPQGLFSHSHMQNFWQTSLDADPGISRTGWGGRMADMLMDSNSSAAVQALYTLTGIHPWEVGEQTTQLSVGSSGLTDFTYLAGAGARATAWGDILAQGYINRLEAHNAIVTDATRYSVTVIKNALESAPAFDSWVTGNNSLSRQLKMAAKLISVRESLNQKRQVIFVGLGGWDTHGNQLVTQASRLGQVNDALMAFNSAMESEGIANSVTTFTASEFGRSLTINGDGTDHAWGAHAMVMGGAVNGNNVYGSLPSLALGGPNDARTDGRIIPTTSIDQYGATLGRWFGINDTDLNEIFPNLVNFPSNDLGFLTI